MGLFDYIANRRGYVSADKVRPVITSDGRGASYSQFGADIYASEIVCQAVQCIANEVKKLEPKHVIRTETQRTIVRDDINRILDTPNEIMTRSDMMEQCVYLLMRKKNVFIYPTYIETGGKRIYTGLYPLKPSQVQFVQDSTDRLFVKFIFNNGVETILPYDEIIHWRYRYSNDDYMGGTGYGDPNDDVSLLDTLRFNKSVRESMQKAANAPVNGVVRYGSVISENKLSEEVARFNAALKNSASGILALDAKSEFQQMSNQLKAVDTETMEFIKQEIVDHFGVSLPMLHSVATVEEKQAFYDKTIEPMILSLNQAFTRCLISQGRRDRFHEIVFYEKDLMFMTMDQKIQFVDTVKDLGVLTKNQILETFGFPPFEGGDIRIQSLNNVDAAIANEYQLNKPTDDSTNDSTDEPTESEGEPDAE